MKWSRAGRRTQINIITQMLDFTSAPRKITHIMYELNLNYGQLKKYLAWLSDMGLVEKISTPYKGYLTTNKGLDFMKMLKTYPGSEDIEKLV